jgi:hypothetical protein
MTTFVTALIDLHEERPSNRSVDFYLEKFETLVSTGINLHVFVSSSYESRIQESSTVKKTVLELEELDTYKELRRLNYVLPPFRSEIKDTEGYLVLMNSKTELIARSIKEDLFNSMQYAWIDFGIFHVLHNSIEQLKYLSETRLGKGIYIPGCSPKNTVVFSEILWRFCGGFFIGDRETLLEFNSLYRSRFAGLVQEVGILSWEVNIWAQLEAEGWEPIWYLADHNDDILRVPCPRSTIVTMFFNLQQLPGAVPSTRSMDFYMKNGRATLSAPAPMVIFCDPSTRPTIEAIRTELSTYPTTYIEKNLADYDYYQSLYPIILNNRAKSPHYASSNSRNTPSHCLTTMFKIPALYMAYQTCPASHYIWLDFGCSYMALDVEKAIVPVIHNPRPRIACGAIHYRSSQELYPMSEYMKWGGPCSLAGTLMTIERDYMELFYSNMMSIFCEQLNEGVGHTEEQVLVYLFDRHPEWFDLYFSDYRSCIVNYHSVCEDYASIKHFFIHEALNKNRRDLAEKCAQDILWSVFHGKLKLPFEEIAWLTSLQT